ncbi:MAG: MBL fold metallo-hydrolase [Telluria sp.]|nr:MBL fold metallo-hydrolase [Telluria sp.]
MDAQVKAFHDATTGTVSYVVYDKTGGHAALIDPVLDYEPKSGHTSTSSADKLIAFVRAQSLTVEWILETHAHADHLSGAQYLKQHLGGKVAIGDRIRQVQGVFQKLFNLDAFAPDGSQFDHLFAEGETFRIGALSARAIFVPGHTPADIAYQVGAAVFVGDTLFMPDVGTARCDFPGGDACTLYRSIRTLLSLPGETRLFMCHDYPPAERDAAWETTVAEQRAHNVHVHDGIGEQDFVAMRQKRDAGLEKPVLILPAIQVNIRAGAMPAAESNGVTYLKIPVNAL